jgi:hypothetical protein
VYEQSDIGNDQPSGDRDHFADPAGHGRSGGRSGPAGGLAGAVESNSAFRTGQPAESPPAAAIIICRLPPLWCDAAAGLTPRTEKKPESRYQQASVLKTQVETIAATPESNQPLKIPPKDSSNARVWTWVGIVNTGFAAVILLWFVTERAFSLPMAIAAVLAIATLVDLAVMRPPRYPAVASAAPSGRAVWRLGSNTSVGSVAARTGTSTTCGPPVIWSRSGSQASPAALRENERSSPAPT